GFSGMCTIRRRHLTMNGDPNANAKTKCGAQFMGRPVTSRSVVGCGRIGTLRSANVVRPLFTACSIQTVRRWDGNKETLEKVHMNRTSTPDYSSLRQTRDWLRALAPVVRTACGVGGVLMF